MLSLEVAERIATVTLDRPPVNAWDGKALDELESITAELRERDDVDLVVATSKGRDFSAGGDIKMMLAAVERQDLTSLTDFAARIQNLYGAWERLAMPTLAVLRGATTGGGLEFALACDLRIASEDARLGLPEGRLGLVAAGGGTQRLTRSVGRGMAMRLMLTGELIDGRTAERLGLVEWCVPPAELEAETTRIVAALTANAGPAQRAVKDCVAHVGTPDGYALETISQRELYASADTQRRLRDFVARRRDA
jgi:enoyl-CoA hydratase